MPAEPRRSTRKATSEEEIELKRARGEISCAECRRLKLKCDKKLPCGSCVRRGCTTICPNGSLSAGLGTRYVLADTEQLHRKISEMSERIRQLEDTLAIFQAGVSNERHPLLRDELLSVKFGPEVRRTIDDEYSRNALSQSIDALGTLTIGDHGETKYIGRSGGSETLILSSGEPQTDDDLQFPDLDPEIANISISFPLTIVQDGYEGILDKLESQLPPQPRAWALCETYIEQFTWWFRPLRRDELIDEILTPIYKSVGSEGKSGYHPQRGAEGGRCPHLLAVLYFVFAVGALVDLTLPACSAEAEKYYQLGRAALSLRGIFDSPEIETVQAVSLMAAYHSLASSRYTLESAWSITSLASKLAQGIGLHRDSVKWELDHKTVQRRRNLFWEIFILEMIHSLALGRPPSVPLSHIDCAAPEDIEESVTENDDVASGYWKWRFLFSKQIYASAVDTLLAAKAPSYETILDLDRTIRQTTLPAVKLYLRPDEEDYNNPGICMKGYLMSQYRCITMLYLHRTFFAQALIDNPLNPLRSPYAPSFLAANRCASVLIKSFIHHFERCPELCTRYWGIWTHAFSAAIILGTTVYRSPNATMAPSALIELDLTIDLFKKGAPQSLRARMAVPILAELRDKATQSYQKFRNRQMMPTLDIQLNLGPEDDSSDRLAMFGGQTRVMFSKILSRRRPKTPGQGSGSSPSVTHGESPSQETSSPSHSASTPSESGAVPESMTDAFSDVHPSLVEYLSFLPSSASLAVVDPLQMDQASSLLDGRSVTTEPQVMEGITATSLSGPSSSAFGSNFIYYGAQSQSLTNGTTGMNTAGGPGMNPPQGMSDLSAFFSASNGPSASSNMQNLGFSEEMVMSEQWTNLMRETGIFDSNGNFAGLQNLNFMPQEAMY